MWGFIRMKRVIKIMHQYDQRERKVDDHTSAVTQGGHIPPSPQHIRLV